MYFFNNLQAAAAVFASAIALSPMAAFAKDLEAGEAVFNGNCAACHAGLENKCLIL